MVSLTSGIHLSETFEKLTGRTTEKQTKKTFWKQNSDEKMKTQDEIKPYLDKKEVSICRNPLVLLCPRGQDLQSGYQPENIFEPF